jgi:hypothetical protein
MKNQTALQSLEEQIAEYLYMCIIESTDKDNRYVKIDTFRIKPMFDRAKAIEKEQIENAYTNALIGSIDQRWVEIHKKQAEQYYNETFKS